MGAGAIVTALARGANLIITGRVADAAVTLAPMMFEFGWSSTNWDLMAAGVVAGHIIECGTQCTGGNFTDWPMVSSFRRMGFPIVEAYEDGTFVVTKHPNTGGLVTVHTVAEQILYEIGSPAYLTPDCVARFDSVVLAQDGPDRVRVTDVRGEPAPEKLKVSISYRGGWRAFGRLLVSGPEALAKANIVAEAFWDAAGGKGLYEQALQQFIGWNGCHAPLATCEPGEVLIQFAVRDSDERKINTRFAPHVVPRALGTVPGITYIADQGRPHASEVVAFWPALVSRDAVKERVVMGDEEIVVDRPSSVVHRRSSLQTIDDRRWATDDPRSVRVPLVRLCLARSGDKGDTANVGVIARSETIYAWVLDHLTAAFVKRYFDDVCRGEVERFELPNLLAVNFLLHQSLGGGGTSSLLLDAQGKTYAQFLLAAEVEVPESLLEPRAARGEGAPQASGETERVLGPRD
jgi:hypothetical protein